MIQYFNKEIFVLIFLLSLIGRSGYSQDGGFIHVHFLYGSKPSKQFKDTERKWFGGILGGHVGIETDRDKVLNFMRKGKVHWFASSRHKHSRYAVHTTNDFWGIFRTLGASVKKTTVVIPITSKQRKKLDSISVAYLNQTPYDYAFFGMRCGAATYEILAQMEIMKPYSYRGTFLKIFYPRKLRKRLLKIAVKNNWDVVRQEGVITRQWEKD